MTWQVAVDGRLNITQDGCCSGSSGQDSKQLALGVLGGGCTSQQYQAKAEPGGTIATTGTPGQAFEDINLYPVSEIFLLQMRTSAHVVLRLYAVPASAVASGGSYPTGFAGGETLETTIDGVLVTTIFTVGAQSVEQVAAEVNASMALAGYATPRASAVSGQLRIDGVATKVDGALGTLSFGGTGAAQLGMTGAPAPTITDAQGQDVDVYGLYIQEFPRTGGNAPTAAQISGTATVDIVAAGNS